jgi:hypothetical protein
VAATRFANLVLYEEAAILTYDLAYHNANVIDSQFAIWSLFDTSAPTTSGSIILVQNAANVVATGGNSIAYKALRIYTPEGDAKSNQEFLGSTATPEGNTFFLIALGMFGILGLSKKYQRA